MGSPDHKESGVVVMQTADRYYVHGYDDKTKRWATRGPIDYERGKQIASGMRRAGYDNVMISTKREPGR